MIAHHPSDFTLARLAAGTLDAGPQLVVATHFSGCERCRGGLRSFEAVGGAMLDGAPPTRLSPDAFARALKRLDETELPAEPAPRVRHPDLPPPLNAYEIGSWRLVRPGFRWRRLKLPESPDANVIMLKVAAGQPVPHHGHLLVGDCLAGESEGEEDDRKPIAAIEPGPWRGRRAIGRQRQRP